MQRPRSAQKNMTKRITALVHLLGCSEKTNWAKQIIAVTTHKIKTAYAYKANLS